MMVMPLKRGREIAGGKTTQSGSEYRKNDDCKWNPEEIDTKWFDFRSMN